MLRQYAAKIVISRTDLRNSVSPATIYLNHASPSNSTDRNRVATDTAR